MKNSWERLHESETKRLFRGEFWVKRGFPKRAILGHKKWSLFVFVPARIPSKLNVDFARIVSRGAEPLPRKRITCRVTGKTCLCRGQTPAKRNCRFSEVVPANQRKRARRRSPGVPGTEFGNPLRIRNPVENALQWGFAKSVPDSLPESLQTLLPLVWFARNASSEFWPPKFKSYCALQSELRSIPQDNAQRRTQSTVTVT